MPLASPRTAYEAWHDRYEVDRNADAPWHRLLLAHLDVARDLAGRRVLEIACGRGGFAHYLARGSTPPACLVAADFSATALAKGRADAPRDGARIRWSVCDLQSIGLQSASFDTIISCESIEHLEKPRAACEEFARLLKPRGRLYLTTPNYLGPLGLYRGYARLIGRPYTEEGQPINRFMLLPRTASWLRRAGLRVRVVDGAGHYLPWPGRPPVRVASADSVPFLRWFALHSLVVADRP